MLIKDIKDIVILMLQDVLLVKQEIKVVLEVELNQLD